MGLKFNTSGGVRGASTFVSLLKSSRVGDCFDAIPIPQLSQHCTGWRSAARVDSVLSLEYHHSLGAQCIFGRAKSPLAPPQTRLEGFSQLPTASLSILSYMYILT